MSILFVVLLSVAITVLAMTVVAWAYFTAQRLNRLHIRVDASVARLRAALDRRAAVAAALEPELAQVAKNAESVAMSSRDFSARLEAEKLLEDALAQRFETQPEPLVEAQTRVHLAHRFYNEAVADTRALRLRPVVRICRLAGRAPMPIFCDLPVH